MRYVFPALLDSTGRRGAHAGRDPRIHDPRHTFAARPLEQCSPIPEMPTTARTFGYGLRWGFEAMLSDFKARGFGLEDRQLQRTDRMSRLHLVMTLALYRAVSTGMWAAEHPALPAEQGARPYSEEGGSQHNVALQA